METISELLDRSAQVFGPNPALRARQRYRTDVWTYDDLRERSARVASWLVERGVTKGDRVVLWAPNSPLWVATFFGVLQLGAIVVPLDVRSGPDFVSRVLEQTEPAVIVHSGEAIGVSSDSHTVQIAEIANLPATRGDPVRASVGPHDIAEIMFTSGTTGDPKGVILTHQNILSDAEATNQVLPCRQEYRLLSILPLSHMFEQTVGLLLPLLAGASVYYPATRQSTTLFRDIRDQKITTISLVPQALQLFLDAIGREVAKSGREKSWRRLQRLAECLPMPARRLLWHDIHRRLGGHLQFFVAGGATVEPEMVHQWELLGIPVYQGYGTTETAPVIAATSPARLKRGSVGKAVPVVEIRLAGDGEILVRGQNVTPGYWHNTAATDQAFRDGWYQTGDLGELDEEGFLYLRGRKRELIVLPNGQNVYAADVERVLLQSEEVESAVVLGFPTPQGFQIHAALLLSTSAKDPDSIVRSANLRLSPHQRIQGYTVWPDADFPRTHTLKVRRHDVLRTILDLREGQVKPPATSASEPVHASPLWRLLSQVTDTPINRLGPKMTLEEAGLDSLARVELLAAIEAELGTYLDESLVGPEMTLTELEALIGGKQSSTRPDFPRWPLSTPASAARRVLQVPSFGLLDAIAPADVSGTESLRGLSPPVLFVANHTSHLDAPAILRALPARWRSRLAVAAAADYFFSRPVLGAGTALLLNAFPFSRDDAVRATIEHCAWLIDHGWSILLFPEGTRSVNGQMGRFKTGAGLLGVELQVPVVPLYLAGLDRILPKGQSLPRRGRAYLRFGTSLCFDASTPYDTATVAMQEAVQSLAQAESERQR